MWKAREGIVFDCGHRIWIQKSEKEKKTKKQKNM